MNFLAIDTTMPQLAIAVSANGKHKSYCYDIAPQKHNSVLLVKINEVLKDVGCTLNDMDCFGVVIGPGSFTGIRVGVATINAFAFALRKNVVEMTSLELARYTAKNEDILALIDCKHGNYYAALFKGEKVEYMEINEQEAKKYNVKHVYYDKASNEALFFVMSDKVEQQAFVKRAKPFYMKKSSAEIKFGL